MTSLPQVPPAAALATALSAHGLPSVPQAELDGLVGTWLDEAAARSPACSVPLPAVFERLAASLRTQAGQDVLGALRQVRFADLYLAVGCTLGDRRAIDQLEAEYVSKLGGLLARWSLRDPSPDDALQLVRQRLLMGESPAIASYEGRGSLAAWLRVVAGRVVVDLQRRKGPYLEQAVGEEVVLAWAGVVDPELQHLKLAYQREIKAAFEEAIAGLTAHQRNLMRHQLLHGLTHAQIAAIYQSHRTTIATHLDQIRQQLIDHVHRQLRDRLRLGTDDIDSLLRIARSELELSVQRILTVALETDDKS